MPEIDENPIHDAREALRKHFGFREFLDGQEPVMASILSGRDTMVIMPTGGGKSLCYQLPAMVMDGVTVVVSPLIALMKDQVDALERRGHGAEAPLFFLCRSGGRSAAAARAAAQAGLGRCYNIVDGFEGPTDSSRHRGQVAGWKASDLPWVQS